MAAETNSLNQNISFFFFFSETRFILPAELKLLSRASRYLLNTHLLELLLPVVRVAVVVVSRGGELAEDAGVSVVAQVGQVGDVELEFTAVLGQGEQGGDHLLQSGGGQTV